VKITVEIDDRQIREDVDHAYENAINLFAAEWRRRVEKGPVEKTDAELLNAALEINGLPGRVPADFTWPTRYMLLPEVRHIAEAVFAEREMVR
jgi:hypothetical protein